MSKNTKNAHFSVSCWEAELFDLLINKYIKKHVLWAVRISVILSPSKKCSILFCHHHLRCNDLDHRCLSSYHFSSSAAGNSAFWMNKHFFNKSLTTRWTLPYFLLSGFFGFFSGPNYSLKMKVLTKMKVQELFVTIFFAFGIFGFFPVQITLWRWRFASCLLPYFLLSGFFGFFPVQITLWRWRSRQRWRFSSCSLPYFLLSGFFDFGSARTIDECKKRELLSLIKSCYWAAWNPLSSPSLLMAEMYIFVCIFQNLLLQLHNWIFPPF